MIGQALKWLIRPGWTRKYSNPLKDSIELFEHTQRLRQAVGKTENPVVKLVDLDGNVVQEEIMLNDFKKALDHLSEGDKYKAWAVAVALTPEREGGLYDLNVTFAYVFWALSMLASVYMAALILSPLGVSQFHGGLQLWFAVCSTGLIGLGLLQVGAVCMYRAYCIFYQQLPTYRRWLVKGRKLMPVELVRDGGDKG